MEASLNFDIAADELEIFLDEVNEHLLGLENGILALEQSSGSDDIINSVFRAAHTLKALAGTVGHHKMAELTHTMETLFDAMRDGKLAPTQTVADDLFSTVDALKALRDEIVTRQPSNVDVEAFLVQLRAIMEGEKNNGALSGKIEAAATNRAGKLNLEQETKLEECRQNGHAILEVAVTVDATGFAPAARLSQAAMALMEAGEIILQEPSMEDLVNSRHNNRLAAVIATKAEIKDVEKLLVDVSELTSFEVQPFQVETSAPAAKPAIKLTTPGTNTDISAEKTVRISVERLDSLMNLVGELVTGRNRLLQIEDTLLGHCGKQGAVGELGEMTAHIGRVVDQLQEEVMRARMLPISYVFNKIPRLVRDLSRNVGKQVNLVIEGEDTELDRSLIEFIGDPLIHLLRNAMDHGVESPQTRLAAGKQPTGSIRLTAAHEEGHIVITIEDDGQGIDPERVRQAAVKRGIMSAEEAAQLSDDEAIDLIFRPNLSTAEKVTEVSGRGVGMDVVRANIERLSGSVVVDSKLGQGTTFRITLPLTLAIVQAMLVALDNCVYAIPLAGIVESLYLADVEIHTVKGTPTILWRDSVLPLLELHKYFETFRFSRNGHGSTTQEAKKAIVTVAWGKQRAGLVVDGIIGKQDIVVKSLSPIMGELPGLSGAAILGDGRIALIVDIPGLIGIALQARK